MKKARPGIIDTRAGRIAFSYAALRLSLPAVAGVAAKLQSPTPAGFATLRRARKGWGTPRAELTGRSYCCWSRR